MKKRVGILGLMAAMAMVLFHPVVASAQDRDDYRRGYGQHEYRDRDGRRDDRWREHEWREARERQEWREHQEWRERQEWRDHHERLYFNYGYQAPVRPYGYYGQ